MRAVNMKTTIIDHIKGLDLPSDWAKRADVDPDEDVQVIIGPSRDAAVKELLKIMDSMAEAAERNGLTEEKLAELLKDDD